jgi:hypothetical protein
MQCLDQQRLKLHDAVVASSVVQDRRPSPTCIELTAVASGDCSGIARHLMYVARSGAGDTTVQQPAVMRRADRDERESPLAAKVGIVIGLETIRAVLQPRAMSSAAA